ncbi:hypothetical protein EK904_003721 [Melospiza melodia maxima]|nr:hypothetical protein EK904_003721 [Melospiza melodia maxima]
MHPVMEIQGQDDFSLEDAVLGESTKKPLVTQKTPSSNKDDFDLSDAFDFGDPKPQPPANPRETDNPKKDPPKESDKFDDLDLLDGGLPREGGSDGSGSNERKGPAPNSDQESEGSQGVLAGILSAVGATVVASVGSFIAYQKKKLCFKQSADEENVNMDSHRGAQSEPPVLTIKISKQDTYLQYILLSAHTSGELNKKKSGEEQTFGTG